MIPSLRESNYNPYLEERRRGTGGRKETDAESSLLLEVNVAEARALQNRKVEQIENVFIGSASKPGEIQITLNPRQYIWSKVSKWYEGNNSK